MRGTQWRDNLLAAVETAKTYRDTEDLLFQLKVDRELEFAKLLMDRYPHYIAGYPETVQKFKAVYDTWTFHSHLEIGTPAEVQQLLEENNVQL